MAGHDEQQVERDDLLDQEPEADARSDGATAGVLAAVGRSLGVAARGLNNGIDAVIRSLQPVPRDALQTRRQAVEPLLRRLAEMLAQTANDLTVLADDEAFWELLEQVMRWRKVPAVTPRALDRPEQPSPEQPAVDASPAEAPPETAAAEPPPEAAVEQAADSDAAAEDPMAGVLDGLEGEAEGDDGEAPSQENADEESAAGDAGDAGDEGGQQAKDKQDKKNKRDS